MSKQQMTVRMDVGIALEIEAQAKRANRSVSAEMESIFIKYWPVIRDAEKREIKRAEKALKDIIVT